MSEAVANSPHPILRLWRRLAPLFVVNAFYFGVLIYPILRIWTLFTGTLPGTPVLLVIMVGPLLGRLVYEFVPGSFSRWLSATTLTWLGICFMAFPMVISFELLRWLIPLSSGTWGLLLAASLCTVGCYAFVNAQRIRIREIPIALPNAPSGLTVAQISDVHVGSRSGRFLNRVVRRVNAQAPDLILITGDLIDFKDISSEELGALAQLNAPSYFIIGNHERYVDLDAICARLRGHGIHVLRDDTVQVGSLQIIGIDDAEPRSQVRRVLRSLEPEPEACRILLYHRPHGAEDAAAWGAHMMLCGHTHNGQIVPFNFIVRRVFPRIQGLYDVAGMQLYVNPGTGTWGPILRLGSRSEISLFTLSRKSND